MEISVKIMADVVESFLGALMLDQGLEEVEKFLQAHLFPKLSVSKNLTTCTCICILLQQSGPPLWLYIRTFSTSLLEIPNKGDVILTLMFTDGHIAIVYSSALIFSVYRTF